MQILKDMGITEYEPRVINQMLEFTYSKFDALLCDNPVRVLEFSCSSVTLSYKLLISSAV